MSRFSGDFVKRDIAGNTESVACRDCGEVIAGWVDHEAGVVEGRVVIRQRFKVLSNFAKLQLKLDNGAIYEPSVCMQCLDRITPDDYDDLLKADILAWQLEAEAHGRAMTEQFYSFINHMRERTVRRE